MQIFIICTTFEVKSELQLSCELELHYRSEVLTQSPLLMNQSPRNRLFRLNPLMFSGNDAVNEGFSNHGDTTMLRLYIVQCRFAFQEIVTKLKFKLANWRQKGTANPKESESLFQSTSYPRKLFLVF